jgi:hypothetical protein
MPCCIASCRRCAKLLKRCKTLGQGGAIPKKILIHLGTQKSACLGLDRRKAVFVDQHGLVRKPLAPGFFRNLIEEAFAELAGKRREVQPFQFLVMTYAKHRARHRRFGSNR